MEAKVCYCCGVEKPLSEFGKNKNRKDGLHYVCKICHVIQVGESQKKHHGRHVERYKKHYADNREKRNKYSKEYRQQNKAAHNARANKRRAVKLNATPEWSDLEQITEFYECCLAFKLYSGGEYHVDHIVPLQSKLVCGLHVPANLQVLEAKDNLSKKNSWWPNMP
jgi:hypothetical protein